MKYGILAAAFLFTAQASLAEDPSRLIDGCQQLVRIYDKKGQSQLLAGWTTSVSDALKAGYCRGVIDEFRRSHACSGRSWHLLATRIAGAGETALGTSTAQLLGAACGRK